MNKGMSAILLLYSVASEISAYQIAPLRSGFITKYTINSTYHRADADLSTTFDLYLRGTGVDGRYEAIIRNLDYNVTLGRRVLPVNDPSQHLKDHVVNRQFYIVYDSNGNAQTEFPGDYDSDKLKNSFFNYWDLISFDQRLSLELRAGGANYERLVNSSLDGNTRECRAKFQLFTHLNAYGVEYAVNMSNCQKDQELRSVIYPHADDYYLHVKQELQRSDFSLKERTINFQIFDGSKKVEKSGATTIEFKGFLDERDHAEVFQPRAGPLTLNRIKVTEVFPFKPSHDTKYRVTAFSRDYKSTIYPYFDFHIRRGANDYFAFGSITNISHPTYYGAVDIRKLFKAAFERIFVFGFDEQGKPVFKYLDEGGDDRHVGHLPLYHELLKYDRETVQRIPKSQLDPFETPINFESVNFGEGCTAKHEIEDLGGYLETSFKVDTGATCGQGSNGTFFGLFGKRPPSEDGLKWTIKQTVFKGVKTLRSHSTGIEWQSLKDKYEKLKARVVLTFDGFVPQGENDDRVFNIYGGVVQENFFPTLID